MKIPREWIEPGYQLRNWYYVKPEYHKTVEAMATLCYVRETDEMSARYYRERQPGLRKDYPLYVVNVDSETQLRVWHEIVEDKQ